jgi:hypothetical protein
VIVAVVSSSGCYPMLAHPTRVERGVALTHVGGLQAFVDSSLVDGTATTRLLPSFTLGIAVEMRDSLRSDGPAARLQLGAALTSLIADLYAELPREAFGDFDAGLGIGGQRGVMEFVMPYAQFGRSFGGGHFWFLSNGVALTRHLDPSGWRPVWMPTVGFGRSTPQLHHTLFVTAIVGRRPPEGSTTCFVCAGPSAVTQHTFLLVGLTREGRLPPPRRRQPSWPLRPNRP